MRYFYDTEFIEDGKTIDLISIGIVAEDGRRLYMESADCDFTKANEWVQQNVMTHLTGPTYSKATIATALRDFCNPDLYSEPEFWGYYSAYDHVVLCQLFGTMMDLPKGWPYYTRDLRQWADSLGITKPLDQFVAAETEHHALADARWNQEVYRFLSRKA
jgi:hypothetical protein